MVVLVKCVRLALSEQSERKYASRVSVSEHMRVGFLSYEVAKNAREQARPDLYTSVASLIERSEINEKKAKKLKLRVCIYYICIEYVGLFKARFYGSLQIRKATFLI